ncbi:MAG: short-chain dehydrogenase [Flavobacteriales bacterium]|nr:short-chain dehydrogenase [Flavobacteriales bacterium]
MKKILKYNLKRWSLAHRYYRITRFYSFLKNTAYQAFFVIVIFVLLLMVVNYFMNINLLIEHILVTYSPKIVILFFLISESILGLIPPEIFILWSAKSGSTLLFLFILATASYIGGVLSYFIGMRISLMPAVRKHVERKIKQHIINLRKWGGLFIVLGAIFPIPHAIVSIGAGLIDYKFKYYLLWSLFRYLRFVIYYILILQVL